MKKKFTALVYKEEGIYIARCKEYLITEIGNTEEEAISKLRSAIKDYSKKYKLKEIKQDISKYFKEAKEIEFEIDLD